MPEDIPEHDWSAYCRLCGRPVLPHEPLVSWFQKREDKYTEARGAVHLDCLTSHMIRCDYCGDALPSVKDRAHIPTTPDIQLLGFSADKVVCPECTSTTSGGSTSPKVHEPTDQESGAEL